MEDSVLGKILRPHTNEEGHTCSSLMGRILCNCGRDDEISQIQALVEQQVLIGRKAEIQAIMARPVKYMDEDDFYMSDRLEELDRQIDNLNLKGK